MAFNDALLQQGFVPGGATPQIIKEPGGKPGFGSTSGLEQALIDIRRMATEQEKREEKKAKKQKDRFEMFKTLREAGYSSDKAYAAIESGDLPDFAPADEKGKADLEKTKATTEKTTQEALKLKRENEGLTVKSKKDLEASILNKVATGKALTKGEQQIYDDVLKRRKDDDSGFGNLNFGGQDEVRTPAGEPGIRVINPQGKPGIYNKVKWEKNKQTLLRKGWRAQ